MLFSSITFLVFFLPSVLLLYYALPNLTYKNCILFLASLLFYAWGEPKFVFLMLASVFFNYNMGLFINHHRDKSKIILAISIIVNLGILFVFKYLGFSCKIIDYFLSFVNIKPLTAINLIMPIGISFYTFQEISYLIDVYRNPEYTQKNFLNLGLYITFFPQLIAGPIVRYHDINEQISKRNVTVSQFSNGLERFIIGLAKKVLLANTFALVCDSIYDTDFFSYGTYIAWIAAIAYALQIYYDFSGYSDMAIGLAKLFGFELLENFNYPYAAASITDFWKRWHISLTNFFRDYIYIPLGGNRKGKTRTVLNRFIVFFTTGLWHGAAFNFIFWGLCHGTLMSVERNLFIKKNEKKLNLFQSVLLRIYTLLAILLLWVLFRNGTGESVKIVLKMFGINYTQFSVYQPICYDELLTPKIDPKFYAFCIAGILFSFPWWRKFHFNMKNELVSNLFLIVKYIVLVILLLFCYVSLAGNSYNPFIYFRF
jgi:alginate O-acetyltransferase complex protein AlgI